MVYYDTKPNVYDGSLQTEYDKLLDLVARLGMPKLGRWVYCKYCYKNVLPNLAFFDGLIECSECKAGLAPLEDVIRAGSYQTWENNLWKQYSKTLETIFKERGE